MRLRLGTRGSALAVGQSGLVADALRALGHDVEMVRVTTTGDVERGSLTRLDNLGVFAARLREKVLAGECDFAVHSLKDLPVRPVPGLALAAVPSREDPADVLCARDGLTLDGLPSGARVGTGSPRRVAQLRSARSDLRFVDVRGNVGTRLARVAAGDLDAVVLAGAGLRRLGMSSQITDTLDLLPAPGQGALAIECRAEQDEVLEVLALLDDPATRAAVVEEREVLAVLGGGCAAPIAALAHRGLLRAGVFSLDGSSAVRVEVPFAPGAGAEAAARLLAGGAAGIADLGASRASRLAGFHDESSLWGGEAVLAGLRVLLPRAEGALAEGIRAAGAEVVSAPLTRRVNIATEHTLVGADWVVLTSPATLDALDELGIELPATAQLAAVGPATAQALARRGRRADLVPHDESSGASLAARWPDGAGRVAIPGSALSSGAIAAALTGKGYEVDQFAVYTVEPVAQAPAGLVAEYRAGHFDAVVVTAGSVGAAVDKLLGWRDSVAVIAFGPPSSAALAGLGVEVAAVAATQDADGVIAALAAAGGRIHG